MVPPRGFEEITVKPLGHQSGRDRYPRKYVEDNEIEVPRCAAWGMNLTALSQVYNMYIVAYGSKIHIYKPTGPQQLLATEPLLVLDLPSTPEADRIRAHDPYSSHSINHLLVGNLGTQEIILCACADGDILAYYTTPVYRSSLTPPSTPPATPTSSTPPLKPHQPTPFFHECVGISAWGLAIHSQSRLIAVSSNAHEVQVFAFALSSPILHPIDYSSSTPVCSFPALTSHPTSPPPRTGNFRLRMPLGVRGDNIPSIAFTSTPEGEADSVIASDIRGALWFLPLWGGGERTRVPTTPGDVNWRREPQGWGVLVLDDKFGRSAKGVGEAFGCVPGERERGWDISRSIAEVRGSRVGERREYPGGFLAWGYGAGGGVDVGEVEGVDLGLYWGNFLDEGELEDDDMDADEDFDGDLDDGDDDDDDDEEDEEEEEEEEEESDDSATDQPTTPLPVPVPPHHLILHLNRHALTLYPPTCKPTFCSPLLRQDTSHAAAPFAHPMDFYNRLNMAVPVPGISCVVIGSQVGRVGLMKIMKGGVRVERGRKDNGSRSGSSGGMGNGNRSGSRSESGSGSGSGSSNGRKKGANGGPTTTMRLEAILPFAYQEGRNRERPTTGLHGVAVSPMPEWLPGLEGSLVDEGGNGGEGGGKRRKRGVKRWRVMMQYWDLSVLSYVISDERALEAENL